MTLLLSHSDIQRAVTMQEALDLLERGFVEFGQGNVVMPQRLSLNMPEHNGLCAFMPAWMPGMGAMAIKTVAAFKGNPNRGLPTIFGTLTLLDPETGAPLAIMDAAYLTALRTGAASGLASKYLARHNARIVAIIGAGVQARTQFEAVSIVRDIEQVRVFDIDKQRADSFAQEMGTFRPKPIRIDVKTRPKDAIAGADIVVTASTSPTPVLEGDDLSLGTHVNAVGSHAPTLRELDTKTVLRSKIICDSPKACMVEAGDLIIPIQEGAMTESHIHGGLADVVCGNLPGRESDEEITLFKSVGLAFEDAAVAWHAYHKARDGGLGLEFQF